MPKKVVLYALVAGFVILAAVRPVFDPDVFWHLATGRLILEQGIPTKNTFSFTWPDNPWNVTQWLFEVVIYGVHKLGGFNGLIAFTVALLVLTFLVTADTVALMGGCLSWWCMPLFLVVIHFSRFRMVPRPHLVSFLCLSIILNLWFRKKSGKVWALLPVVAVLWSNSHAGIVFGAALVLCLLGGAAANLLFMKGDEDARREWREGLRFTALFLPFTLVNSTFLYTFRYGFEHLFVTSIVPIAEFAHASFRPHETFFLYGLVFLISLVVIPRRRLAPSILTGVTFFCLSLWAIRVIPKFGVVTLPFVALACGGPSEGASRARENLKRVVTAALLASVLWFGCRDFRLQPPGIGFDGSDLPVGAAAFISENHPPGNFYNDFDDGGYLIFSLYPEKKVFQDGRVQSYPPDFFREILSSMSQTAWVKLMERYHVEGAVVKRRSFGSRIDMSPFFPQPGWTLVYIDGSAYVFVRNTKESEAIAKKFGFRILKPGLNGGDVTGALRAAPAVLRSELRRLDAHLFTDRDELSSLGLASYFLGETDLARAFLTRGKELHSWDMFMLFNLALVERDLGRKDLAREYCEKILVQTRDDRLRRSAERLLKEL